MLPFIVKNPSKAVLFIKDLLSFGKLNPLRVG